LVLSLSRNDERREREEGTRNRTTLAPSALHDAAGADQPITVGRNRPALSEFLCRGRPWG